MKYILLIFLMLISQPIMFSKPRYTVELGNPIKGDIEAVVEAPVKVGVVTPSYSDTWDEHLCLTHNIFWEARGEGEIGMKMVAQVTLNRVRSDKRYLKNTICEVVKTKGAFSWYADGKSDRPTDKKAWKQAKDIARKAMTGDYKHLTNSLYFKVCEHESSFFDKLKFKHKWKRHCFYTYE